MGENKLKNDKVTVHARVYEIGRDVKKLIERHDTCVQVVLHVPLKDARKLGAFLGGWCDFSVSKSKIDC